MSPPDRITYRCPACGNQTLIIDSIGHFVCSWLKCTDPCAFSDRIDTMLAPPALGEAVDARPDLAQSALTLERLWELTGPTVETFARLYGLDVHAATDLRRAMASYGEMLLQYHVHDGEAHDLAGRLREMIADLDGGSYSERHNLEQETCEHIALVLAALADRVARPQEP